MPKKKRSRSRSTKSSKSSGVLFLVSNWTIVVSVLAFFMMLIIFSNIRNESFCANSLSCISNLTGKYEENAKKGEFAGAVVNVPEISKTTQITRVLGAAEAANKRIEVDLTNQRLTAFENNSPVFSFPVSTGKWGKTPTGEFSIWIKLRYTRMKGGSRELGTFYDLPNVPYTMFFYNDKVPKYKGFGIHGAYWHNNFGHPMSHGCVNMALPDVEQLYNWATPESSGGTTYATVENPGTRIVIFGTAPAE